MTRFSKLQHVAALLALMGTAAACSSKDPAPQPAAEEETVGQSEQKVEEATAEKAFGDTAAATGTLNLSQELSTVRSLRSGVVLLNKPLANACEDLGNGIDLEDVNVPECMAVAEETDGFSLTLTDCPLVPNSDVDTLSGTGMVTCAADQLDASLALTATSEHRTVAFALTFSDADVTDGMVGTVTGSEISVTVSKEVDENGKHVEIDDLTFAIAGPAPIKVGVATASPDSGVTVTWTDIPDKTMTFGFDLTTQGTKVSGAIAGNYVDDKVTADFTGTTELDKQSLQFTIGADIAIGDGSTLDADIAMQFDSATSGGSGSLGFTLDLAGVLVIGTEQDQPISIATAGGEITFDGSLTGEIPGLATSITGKVDGVTISLDASQTSLYPYQGSLSVDAESPLGDRSLVTTYQAGTPSHGFVHVSDRIDPIVGKTTQAYYCHKLGTGGSSDTPAETKPSDPDGADQADVDECE